MAGIYVLAAAYVISHFYRAFLAVLSPVLTAELGLTPAELSNALGAWFAAFALNQFVIGTLLDRIGPRWTSAGLFAVFGAGGALLFAAAQSYTHVLVAMVALGVGCSPILMASVYIFKRSFSAEKFALLTSINIAVGLAGNVLGTAPLAQAMEVLGWRGVLVALAGTTLLLSLLILFLVKDPKRTETPGKGSYFDILKLRYLWFILPLIFFNYAVAGGIRGIWTGPYLSEIHGLDASQIGNATLFMATAMVVGSMAYGPADQWFNTRKWVIVVGSVISVVALYFWAATKGLQPGTITIILVIMGLFSMSYGVLMAHATARIPDHLAGRGVTLINFFNMGGVGVMQWVTAEVYRAHVLESQPDHAFHAVLWTYALCFTAALTLYLFSRDAPPRESP